MRENEASSTAFTVLQGMVYISSQARFAGFVAPDQEAACRQILEASAEGMRRLKQLKNPLFAAAIPLMENLLTPGLLLHYPVRKRFFEEACIRALDEGYTQVVNIGAGFDTLLWRLHSRYPEVNFVEIDHPASSQVKQGAVSGKGDNLSLLPVDLSKTKLEAALAGYPGFDSSRRTFYICEGVLMYLELGAVNGVFESLRTITKAGVRFAFSAVSPMNSPTNNTRVLLRLYLKLKSEPLSWSLELSALEAFVEPLGYRVLETGDDERLIKRYVPSATPRSIHKGEFLAVCEAEQSLEAGESLDVVSESL
jgi:methyltransferase (TIGR00027 family)